MVKRPTGSGGEPSSPNCESSAGVKARHLFCQTTGICPTDDIEVSRDFSRDPLFIKATRFGSLAGVTDLMGRAQQVVCKGL